MIDCAVNLNLVPDFAPNSGPGIVTDFDPSRALDSNEDANFLRFGTCSAASSATFPTTPAASNEDAVDPMPSPP
ncbi:hypothetical protein EVAR_84762_1 [Eumeta japonica]|uniref:Uncharacterized protein n=1 Tax=Eumeta variegata TaxID=151549 RepID=A0A4C1U811_EUMVA|nr:hypothetical protein EVAR_84762_1 [Eumeta japonica]